jgi:zinc transport system substrate-binding protein
LKICLALLSFFVFSNVTAQPHYVATIFPIKEIVKNVVGSRGVVESIMPPGASPHTYQLKPSDIKRVNAATALFAGDEHLDQWAHKFKNPNTIETFHLLPHESHLHITGYVGKSRGKSFGEDPHFWTDPLTVKALLPKLVEKLSILDPQGAKDYAANALQFGKELERLTKEISTSLQPVKGKAVLLTHPFFQYFLKRFDIPLAGVIEPLPGTEPTPREVAEIIKDVRKRKISVILGHPQHSLRPALLIAESTNCSIEKLDPLGGVKGRESYSDMVRYNADKILEVFSK